MATPQTEKGYIQIATELWEALTRYRISGEEMKVFMAVVRKTYGFRKKSDHISLSQLQEMTTMNKPNSLRALKKLLHKNLVIKSDNGELSVNKNYETWQPLSKKITPVVQIDNDVIKIDNKSLSKVIPTIEKKDNLTKEITTNVVTEFGNSDINAASKYFLEVMQIPKEDQPVRVCRRYWAILLRESKRGLEGVRWLIDLAGRDEFYRNNITSAKDLYYKRVKLVARARGNSPRISVMEGGQSEKLATNSGDESLLLN